MRDAEHPDRVHVGARRLSADREDDRGSSTGAVDNQGLLWTSVAGRCGRHRATRMMHAAMSRAYATRAARSWASPERLTTCREAVAAHGTRHEFGIDTVAGSTRSRAEPSDPGTGRLPAPTGYGGCSTWNGR